MCHLITREHEVRRGTLAVGATFVPDFSSQHTAPAPPWGSVLPGEIPVCNTSSQLRLKPDLAPALSLPIKVAIIAT